MAQTRAQKVELAISYNKIAGGNLSKSYYKKATIYGDYIELKVYIEAQFTFRGDDTPKPRDDSNSRTSYSLARAKNSLYKLIVGNIGRYGNYKPLFVTLTYKKPGQPHAQCVKDFKYYLDCFYRKYGYKPKYVAVPQIQWERYKKEKIKTWHFHICFFNVPPLDFSTHDALWKHGWVNTQAVRGIRSIGAYLAGYFTKQDWQAIPFGKRYYYSSHGLIKPIEIYDHEAIDDMFKASNIKLISTFNGENFTHYKYKIT